MNQAISNEIQSLREQIQRHDALYYVHATPEITDFEYDQLMRRLVELEKQHPEYDSNDSPSHKVGGQPIDGFVTVEHRVPMLSIDNVYNEEELAEFGQRVHKLLEGKTCEWIVEYKVDGVALSLIYEKGHLVRAVTRGDGRRGDDVTHNARTMRGVPLQLMSVIHHSKKPTLDLVPAVLEVRGEAFIANSAFSQLQAEAVDRGEEPLKNSRNATAGAI
ncbi:MAG: NAD-dependent DNA ligase LigA, partial [Planctomycetes bacterium]|nr:NAD-dependent DNA ligase LigA [Planctomycetota bacterium]